MLKRCNSADHTERQWWYRRSVSHGQFSWIDIATGIKIWVNSFENKDTRKNMIFQINTTTRFFKAYFLQCMHHQMFIKTRIMPDYVKSFLSSHAKWRPKPWPTLVRAMACSITASSYYLCKCWIIINELFLHSPNDNFIRNCQYIFPGASFKQLIQDYSRITQGPMI